MICWDVTPCSFVSKAAGPLETLVCVYITTQCNSRSPRNTGMCIHNYTVQQPFIILNFCMYLKNLFCSAKHAINFITNCASHITSCPQVIIPLHNNCRQHTQWQTKQNIYKFRNLFIATVHFTTHHSFTVKWCQPLIILLLEWLKTQYVSQ